MKRNNKGFSLIELVIVIAIMAVAGVSVVGFVVNTSHSYRRTNTEIKLQYEQQMAVNQIRDMVVESDEGIYFDTASKTLALYGARKDEGGSVSYPVTVIAYHQTEQKLYFGTKEFTDIDHVSFADVTDLKLLAENVTEFKVDLTNVKNDKVQFEVTFRVGEKTQTAKETVALRNRLVVSNEADTIWGDIPELVESFIKGIAISRGSKVFAAGELDTIGKAGQSQSVSVAYEAQITANDESTREYAVAWSIDAQSGVSLTGVSVSSDGVVTVDASVEDGTRFNLNAVSVDDPTKTSYIQIEVSGVGVYPVSAELKVGAYTAGNGYRTYPLTAALTYTDGSTRTSEQDHTLFTWLGVSSLPAGCSFDEGTGLFTLTSNANGISFTIQAKANERRADGSVVLSNEIVISIGAGEIPDYTSGPSVNIVTSSNLSRGGYIYPTMVLKNAAHSYYRYTWKIEAYKDEDSTEWNSVDNSSFDLISLAGTGNSYYNSWDVKHEMTSDTMNRSIAINCAEWLNWDKTFKIKISGTAIDTRNPDVVLIAVPKIITIDPVAFRIELTDDNRLYGEDYKKPLLTDTTLRYEDWQWENKTEGTEEAKWSATRRRYTSDFDHIYIVAGNMQGCEYEHHFLFKNQAGTVLSNDTVGNPTTVFEGTKLVTGFGKQMILWEKLADRPVFMNHSITLKDKHGNSISSNTVEFKIVYEFYHHMTEKE